MYYDILKAGSRARKYRDQDIQKCYYEHDKDNFVCLLSPRLLRSTPPCRGARDARRLGHGLALADDRLLMNRARDDVVCVELCPVSNFQTNAVYPYGESGHGREYPLRESLKNGINVCINTDNPVISCTNMVKECFQAWYAYGEPGLSLWDLLRILRAGFTQSFLTQPERRALLELASQIVFDLFSKPEVVQLLQVQTSK